MTRDDLKALAETWRKLQAEATSAHDAFRRAETLFQRKEAELQALTDATARAHAEAMEHAAVTRRTERAHVLALHARHMASNAAANEAGVELSEAMVALLLEVPHA